jgi:cytochrome c biogenesis protein ResB
VENTNYVMKILQTKPFFNVKLAKLSIFATKGREKTIGPLI